jgi:hypothetical protein
MIAATHVSLHCLQLRKFPAFERHASITLHFKVPELRAHGSEEMLWVLLLPVSG